MSLLFWTAIASVFLVLTIFLQAGWGYTPLHAGLTFLPLAGASVLGSGVAVPLAPRIGRTVVQLGCNARRPPQSHAEGRERVRRPDILDRRVRWADVEAP